MFDSLWTRESQDIQIRLTCRPLINHVKRGQTPPEQARQGPWQQTPNGITTLVGNYTTLSNLNSCKYNPKLNIPLCMPTLRPLARSVHPITVCCGRDRRTRRPRLTASSVAPTIDFNTIQTFANGNSFAKVCRLFFHSFPLCSPASALTSKISSDQGFLFFLSLFSRLIQCSLVFSSSPELIACLLWKCWSTWPVTFHEV